MKLEAQALATREPQPPNHRDEARVRLPSAEIVVALQLSKTAILGGKDRGSFRFAPVLLRGVILGSGLHPEVGHFRLPLHEGQDGHGLNGHSRVREGLREVASQARQGARVEIVLRSSKEGEARHSLGTALCAARLGELSGHPFIECRQVGYELEGIAEGSNDDRVVLVLSPSEALERGRTRPFHMLLHVLNHPEIGAIIGTWQENCPGSRGSGATLGPRGVYFTNLATSSLMRLTTSVTAADLAMIVGPWLKRSTSPNSMALLSSPIS